MDANSTGPTYTFCGENGGMSYIDHCVITPGLEPRVQSCSVSAHDAKNTSDHLHVSINLNIETPAAPPQQQRVIWHRLAPETIKQLYTEPLERGLGRTNARPLPMVCSTVRHAYRNSYQDHHTVHKQPTTDQNKSILKNILEQTADTTSNGQKGSMENVGPKRTTQG